MRGEADAAVAQPARRAHLAVAVLAPGGGPHDATAPECGRQGIHGRRLAAADAISAGSCPRLLLLQPPVVLEVAEPLLVVDLELLLRLRSLLLLEQVVQGAGGGGSRVVVAPRVQALGQLVLILLQLELPHLYSPQQERRKKKVVGIEWERKNP